MSADEHRRMKFEEGGVPKSLSMVQHFFAARIDEYTIHPEFATGDKYALGSSESLEECVEALRGKRWCREFVEELNG